MRHKRFVKGTTISAYFQINHIADADVDDSEKALVLLLELLLIENLYGKYAVFCGFPGPGVSRCHPWLATKPTCQRLRSNMGSVFS